MKTCIVTLGVDSPPNSGSPKPLEQNFTKGIKLIKNDLEAFGFQGEFLAWNQSYPDGSPTQKQAHGAFKPYCIQEAAARNFQTILWVDASIRIISPLEPVFERIRKFGYLLVSEFDTFSPVGEFCSDDALVTLNISRDESFKMPMCWSCVLGLDLSHKISREFLFRWKKLASDGATFPGAKWSGVYGWPKTVSQDPRVKGHRYDQTAASILACKLGMTEWMTRKEFDYYFRNDRLAVRKYSEWYKDNLGKKLLRYVKRKLNPNMMQPF